MRSDSTLIPKQTPQTRKQKGFLDRLRGRPANTPAPGEKAAESRAETQDLDPRLTAKQCGSEIVAGRQHLAVTTSSSSPTQSISDTSKLTDQPCQSISTDRNKVFDDCIHENERLKAIAELQRQEIIKLRHELAQILSSTTNSNLTSTTNVPKERAQVNHSSSTNDRVRENSTQVFGGSKKRARLESPPKNSNLRGPANSITEPENQSDANRRFDTLSRIINLNQLLRMPGPRDAQLIQIDLLTLQAVKEAAIGLMITLQHDLHKIHQVVLQKQQFTCSSTSISRTLGLISNSIHSVLSPLCVPDEFPIVGSSSNSGKIQNIWQDQVLPIIYQYMESLFDEIISTIIDCCKGLGKYFWEPLETKEGMAENLLTLRQDLQNLANGFLVSSRNWTGKLQVNLIKKLFSKAETVCLNLNHKLSQSEALGVLIEILELSRSNLSESTLSEVNLIEIRGVVEKIMSHERYGSVHTHSSIVDRKFDRILMAFWSI